MPRLRKGELTFYKLMNPTELSKYVKDFPINTEFVKSFLEKYQYNWIKQVWRKGRTI